MGDGWAQSSGCRVLSWCATAFCSGGIWTVRASSSSWLGSSRGRPQEAPVQTRCRGTLTRRTGVAVATRRKLDRGDCGAQVAAEPRSQQEAIGSEQLVLRPSPQVSSRPGSGHQTEPFRYGANASLAALSLVVAGLVLALAGWPFRVCLCELTPLSSLTFPGWAAQTSGPAVWGWH